MDKEDKYSPPTKKKLSDAIHAVSRAGLGAIPIAGSAATELLNHLVTPSLELRRNKWMESVGECLRRLEKNQGINLEKLQNNESFIDIVMKASQAAIRSNQENKLNALRNAILNSAISPDKDEILRNIFLALIDSFSPIHIDFLSDFSGEEESSTSDAVGFSDFVSLQENPFLYRILWKDLVDRGLLDSDQPFPDKNKKMVHCKTTELGNKLLKFIASPFDEK